MTDYSYTEKLNKEQWAWEFLRRNSEYQRDYKTFIHRWRGLEEDYAKSSSSSNFDIKGELHDRDAKRWKNDLRSHANEWQAEMTLLEEFPDSDEDNASQDTVQIEDWMAAKWGYSSFPLDPEFKSPNFPDDLNWQEQTIDLDDIRFDAQTTDPVAQVNFDLRYSLQDQLDAAHKDLITLTSQLQRLGKVKLVASDHYSEWLQQLKILDDPELLKQSSEEQQLAAHRMCQTGYRKILLMRG